MFLHDLTFHIIQSVHWFTLYQNSSWTRAVRDCLIHPFASISECLVSYLCLRTWSRSQGPHSGETWTQYVVQPTESINQLSSWYLKTFRNKVRRSLQTLDMLCYLPDIYTRFQVHISKHVEKLRKFLVVGSSVEIHFPGVCGHQGAKNWPAMTKSSIVQDTCYVSVYQIWRLYISFEALMKKYYFDPFLAVK